MGRKHGVREVELDAQARRGRELRIPGPVVASTVPLGLRNMERLVLSASERERWSDRSLQRGRPSTYHVGLCHLELDEREGGDRRDDEERVCRPSCWVSDHVYCACSPAEAAFGLSGVWGSMRVGLICSSSDKNGVSTSSSLAPVHFRPHRLGRMERSASRQQNILS